ncbi:unnamed protein product [Sphenostylis stenocarpa]|uniref:Uncharacterized protein n=1 Tax=Sphenostylis stenocarpa TaxID=92480 RepID=A0AA86RXB5_9FABA|nr:unnamed protein product [Sphenostylis stenocarpa]
MRIDTFCVSAFASIHSPFPNPKGAVLQDWKLRKHALSLRLTPFPWTSSCRKKRTTFICAANQEAEDAFKKTVEIDRLIDMLRDANPRELQKLVVENILAFNPSFWVRLAARTDTCKSEDDKKDYEELAASVMSVVDCVVHKTNEKIESSTDVLKGVLKPVIDEEGEIPWPPRDPQAVTLMEKVCTEISQREQEGQLDEGFLAEVNAQLRQAKEDGDKPGLEAMLRKVLQLYASKVLSKRSYAIKAPEQEWNNILINGLTIGAGDISAEELFAVLKKRRERVLIRTVRQSNVFIHVVIVPLQVLYVTYVVPLIYPCSFSSLRAAQKQRREALTDSGF